MPDEYTYTPPPSSGSSDEYTYSQPPGILSRIGSQVGDFFSTASHAMNPENLMAQVPTSWEDLKNKWNAETEDAKSKGAAAVNQFKQGNIGTGVSTLMNAEPFIGQPAGQAAEHLRQGDVGKAAGTLAPYFIPAMPDAAAGAANGVRNATNAGLDWAADASAPMAAKVADAINTHPAIAKTVIGAGAAVPTYLAAHALSHDVGMSGFGSFMAAREAAKHIGNAVTDWASQYPEAAAKLKSIDRAAQQRANPGVSLPEQAGVTANPPVVAPPVEPIAGALPGGKVPGGIWNQEAAPAAPTPTVTTPSGPSPQLRAAIAKAVGPNGNVQRVLDDMIARGENDPYTGVSLGGQSAPTTSAPPPTQPTPVSAPVAPTPQPTAPTAGALPHQIQPNSLVVDDIWRHATTGQDRPVSMMSTRGLAQFAKEQGIPVDQARRALEADNYTIPTSKELWQGLTSRGAEMGYNRQALYDKIQNDWGLERATDATTEELLKTYGEILAHPGPLSAQHIGAANYMLGDTGMQPVAPINLPINLRTQP